MIAIGKLTGTVALGACLLAWVSENRWQVEGRKLPWTMNAPAGWIGGSAPQIEKVRATLPDEGVKRLLEEIWYKARRMDVYLVNTDISGITTRTNSSISVDVIDKGFTGEMFTEEMWKALVDIEQNENPGVQIEFLASQVKTVGNHPAHCGVFRSVLSGGGSVYDARCFVLLSAERSHAFQFKADETKAKSHLADFDAMLASLEYQ